MVKTNIEKNHLLWAGLFYLVVVFVLHLPIVTSLGTNIIGGNLVGGVFIWDFSWFAKALFSQPPLNPFFTTDLMYPTGTLVIMESPLHIGLSLLLQILFSPYQTYNILALLNYVFAGFSMYLLAYQVTKSKRGAFMAGFIFMFSHYNLTQHILGHLHDSTIGFVPLLFFGFHIFQTGRKSKGLILFLISAIGICLGSTYLLFEILLIGFPLYVLTQWRKNKKYLLPISVCLVCTGVIGLVLYAPVLANSSHLIGGEGFFSLSILSFFDYPAWHPNGLIQQLRQWTSGGFDSSLLNSTSFIGNKKLIARAAPENLMGFFGLSTIFWTLLGLKLEGVKKLKSWWVLMGTGIILSLGPYVSFNYQPTSLPLPYLLFQSVPGLDLFRAPARMILLTWLGLGILTAANFSNIKKLIHSEWKMNALLVAFLGIFGWEMGLHALGHQFDPLLIGEAYKTVKNSPTTGAILELPVSFKRNGEVSQTAEEFMLYQPFHRRPLVVGRPARYTKSSLSFINQTDVVYELTHPLTIKALYEKPALKQRLDYLKQCGRDHLAKQNIDAVLFHNKNKYFSPEIMGLIKTFLQDIFGPPDLTDEYGRSLFLLQPDDPQKSSAY